ncbi:endoplasmic reticulum resident protein 29-like [Actinia tenebrosa]|uniref:Endoplasmic reticulum resident protein 29-like n=1 Tax=Actinia tenebrosa TaxID=6105 RepID=A0A6P8HAU3_ACTTE|nr:endoplasmic reticulum resident protein 29-like [Actinia tenebrosa]
MAAAWFICFVVFCLHLIHYVSGSAKGAVGLDSLTFDKVISKHRAVLVKFDKQYAYGEKEDIFKEFCKKASSQSELLVAEVGVAEYGDKDNDDLRERFKLKKEDFPYYMLFLQDQEQPVHFKGEIKEDALTAFVSKHAGLWIGLQGCVEKFDKLAEKFLNSAITKADEVISEAETLLKETKHKKYQTAGDIYVKIMKKVKENGEDYIKNEVSRVNKLLKDKITEKKRELFTIRLDILTSFQHFISKKKDEL